MPELIEAFEALCTVRRSRLVLVGRVEDREVMRAAKMSNRVLVLDHVDDVRQLMATFDVLCLPSHREGFPNVVLEAAARPSPPWLQM